MSRSPTAWRRVWIWVGAVTAMIALCIGAGMVLVFLALRNGLFGPPPSGPEWCEEQAGNRPFLKMVNEAAIGGPAWPEQKALFFWFSLRGDPRLGANSADYRTVRDALWPRALESGTERRIEPVQVPAAQAAAARLDLYCATSQE